MTRPHPKRANRVRPARLILAIFTWCVLWVGRMATAEQIPIWVYHNHPPFVIDAEARDGLSYDLADRLTALSGGEFEFTVSVLTRDRLNYRMAQGEPAIVLWANPAWFGDAEETRYMWSAELVLDENAVISPAGSPVDYTGPDAVHGLTLAGVKGHRYPGIDQKVTAGEVARIDLDSEVQVMHFIANARADVSVISAGAARYYAAELGLDSQIHFSDQPHSRYSRHILFSPPYAPICAFVQKAWRDLQTDPDWRDRLVAFGLTPADPEAGQ